MIKNFDNFVFEFNKFVKESSEINFNTLLKSYQREYQIHHMFDILYNKSFWENEKEKIQVINNSNNNESMNDMLFFDSDKFAFFIDRGFDKILWSFSNESELLKILKNNYPFYSDGIIVKDIFFLLNYYIHNLK